MKTKECLSHDNFVAISQYLSITWNQSPPAIDERSVRRAQVFDEVVTFVAHDPGMPARNFSFGIIVIQIHIGKDAAIGVPAADLRVLVTEDELLTR